MFISLLCLTVGTVWQLRAPLATVNFHVLCSSFISTAVVKYCDTKQLREERVVSQFQLMVHRCGKSERGLEAASHIHSLEERMNACIQAHHSAHLPRFTVQDPNLGNDTASSGLGLPISVSCNPDISSVCYSNK